MTDVFQEVHIHNEGDSMREITEEFGSEGHRIEVVASGATEVNADNVPSDVSPLVNAGVYTYDWLVTLGTERLGSISDWDISADGDEKPLRSIIIEAALEKAAGLGGRENPRLSGKVEGMVDYIFRTLVSHVKGTVNEDAHEGEQT
jgi:hypothetical protein